MASDSAARQGVGTCAVCGGWPRHLATLNPCRCTAVIEPSDSAARQVNAQATLHTCDTPNYTDGPCYACAKEKVLEWIFERYENCIRIAGQKSGDDKQSWLEDADHFMFVLQLLKRPSLEAASVPAPAPSEAPQKEIRLRDFIPAEQQRLDAEARKIADMLWESYQGTKGRHVWEAAYHGAFELVMSVHHPRLGAPSEAKPTTELKSEQAEEEFYKWWQPKTLIGGRFHGYSENWGAKDAWVAARSEPPAEASPE